MSLTWYDLFCDRCIAKLEKNRGMSIDDAYDIGKLSSATTTYATDPPVALGCFSTPPGTPAPTWPSLTARAIGADFGCAQYLD